jgi:hypothetical protein
MGTTTNNGWPTPVATDLVKDGWEAIKDLGDAIDTTLGVYAPSTSGLTLINTTSFSGVASQSINDVFSSTYENYHIIISATDTGTNFLTMRLRVSGSDVSTNTYRWSRSYVVSSSATVTGENANAVSSWSLAYINGATTTSSTQNLNILNPFLAKPTTFNGFNTRLDSSLSVFNAQGGANDNATSYTGFTLIGVTNMTGSISVYGYNK